MGILIHSATSSFRPTPNFEPTIKTFKFMQPTRPKQPFDSLHPRTHKSTRNIENVRSKDRFRLNKRFLN